MVGRRVALLVPAPADPCAFGVRALAPVLRQAGHRVRVVHLPGGIARTRYRAGYRYQYSDDLVRAVVDLCQDADLVGLSFMTPYLDRAVQVTRALKARVRAPVAWGGIHASADPEGSLAHADLVCRGEAEQALPELLEALGPRPPMGRDLPGDLRNWAFPGPRLNPLRPLEPDLDGLPAFDWSLEDEWVPTPSQRALVPLTAARLQGLLPLWPATEGSFRDNLRARRTSLKTLTSRGCPHACGFCGNATWKALYPGTWGIRYRSPAHVMGELVDLRRRFPFVQAITFFDDAFSARSEDAMDELLDRYRREVGLPFACQVSPGTLTAHKLDAMIDAGLYYVEMGIQSGSALGRRSLGRGGSREEILDAARLIQSRVPRMAALPAYHLILDNPWESREDVLQTLDLVLRIPPPFWLKRSSLVFYPGTPLERRARAEGIPTVDQAPTRHLEQPSGSYVNHLLYLSGFTGLPRSLVRAGAHPALVDLLDRPSLGPLWVRAERDLERVVRLHRALGAVGRGDLERVARAVKNRWGGAE